MFLIILGKSKWYKWSLKYITYYDLILKISNFITCYDLVLNILSFTKFVLNLRFSLTIYYCKITFKFLTKKRMWGAQKKFFEMNSTDKISWKEWERTIYNFKRGKKLINCSFFSLFIVMRNLIFEQPFQHCTVWKPQKLEGKIVIFVLGLIWNFCKKWSQKCNFEKYIIVMK